MDFNNPSDQEILTATRDYIIENPKPIQIYYLIDALLHKYKVVPQSRLRVSREIATVLLSNRSHPDFRVIRGGF